MHQRILEKCIDIMYINSYDCLLLLSEIFHNSFNTLQPYFIIMEVQNIIILQSEFVTAKQHNKYI
jgi:hypothetical protein